jgi:hypothetical protein
MKNRFVAVIGLSLLGVGPVLGQAPAAVPTVSGPATIIVSPVAPCAPDCSTCPATKIACVPEPEIKKTPKPVYCSGCEPLCLCYFHGLFRSCGCDSGECARPYVRRFLIKKIRTCEEPAVKCVPVEVPACGR